MTGLNRLQKLYPALTAKERAILVLKACREDRDEDLRVRQSMPRQQITKFNRLIDLIRGVYHLALYIALLEQSVDNLSLRYGWLLSLVLWGDAVLSLEGYILLYTKEPITESEYSRLLAEARGEMAPPSELAEALVTPIICPSKNRTKGPFVSLIHADGPVTAHPVKRLYSVEWSKTILATLTKEARE